MTNKTSDHAIRPLRGLTTDQLREKWTEAMHAWAASPDNRPQLLDQAEAEFGLRGEELPPVAVVQSALEKIYAAVERRLGEMEVDRNTADTNS
jgi:hypothetical protein